MTDSRVMAVAQLDGLTSPVWLGSPGAGTLEFDRPVGIATHPEGGFLVADSGNHRIVAVASIDGSGWETFGSQGSGTGEFERPGGIAVGSDGRIYVADTGNSRIVRIDDMSGSGWTAFGAHGAPTATNPAAVRLFAAPLSIAVDAANRVTVADPQPGRIVRVSALDGSGWNASAGPPGPRSPVGVASAGSDDVVVADVAGARVAVYPGPTLAPASATAPGAVYAPVALAVDGETVFCLDMGAAAGRVLELSLGAATIGVVSKTALEPLGFRAPRGVCVAP